MESKNVMRGVLVIGVVTMALGPWMSLTAQEEGHHQEETPLQALFEECHQLFLDGEFDAALGLVAKGMKTHPEKRISFLNLAYLILDKTDNVERLIEVAIERALYFEDSPKKSREVVLAYLRGEDIESALEWLETTLQRGYQDHGDLAQNPVWDPLRGHVSFQNATRTVGDKIGINQKARAFSGQTLDGSPTALRDHLGKVVLIDFWALYCAPCREEIELMLDYYPEFHQDGFEIVAINLDEDRSQVAAYIDEKSILWPVIFSGKGWDDDIRSAYGLANIPSYWLIDREGILRHVGLQGKALEESIGNLLKE